MKYLMSSIWIAGALFIVSPASGASQGQGCDTKSGRDTGQQMCDAGLVCTGPFEGSYGRGNCQAIQYSNAGQGCDTKQGRPEGQQMCAPGLTCTGPFEGSYGRGNCQ